MSLIANTRVMPLPARSSESQAHLSFRDYRRLVDFVARELAGGWIAEEDVEILRLLIAALYLDQMASSRYAHAVGAFESRARKLEQRFCEVSRAFEEIPYAR